MAHTGFLDGASSPPVPTDPHWLEASPPPPQSRRPEGEDSPGRAPRGHEGSTWSQCLFGPCKVLHFLPFFPPSLQLMKGKQPEGWGGRDVPRASASAALGGQQSQGLSGMNICVIRAAPRGAGAPPWPALCIGPLCREARGRGLRLPGPQRGLCLQRPPECGPWRSPRNPELRSVCGERTSPTSLWLSPTRPRCSSAGAMSAPWGTPQS